MASRVNGLLLSRTEVAMLWQAARLDDLRKRQRGSDTAMYSLLLKFTEFVYDGPVSVHGNERWKSTEMPDREWWSTHQIADEVSMTARSVTADCANGSLPATKSGRTWVIARGDALTYIERRTKN